MSQLWRKLLSLWQLLCNIELFSLAYISENKVPVPSRKCGLAAG